MSEYINYYICKQDKNTKLIYPLGPFDDLGNLKCVIWKSRSFYTDLINLFSPISKELITNELATKLFELSLEEYNKSLNEDCIYRNSNYYKIHFCPLNELGSCDFIKSGYYLIDDIKRYEMNFNTRNNCDFDGFYERLSPQLYCELLKSENSCKFQRKPAKDCEDNEMDIYYASDYAFYMYPDYSSKEYEAYILYETADMLMPPYERSEYDVVVIFTRG